MLQIHPKHLDKDVIEVDFSLFIHNARWLSDPAYVLGWSSCWDPEDCVDCMTFYDFLNQSRMKSTCGYRAGFWVIH